MPTYLEDEIIRIAAKAGAEAAIQKEAEKKIKDAIAEIDATFLAENESLDQIYRDVQISEVYQDGQVEADWSFDDYTYVSADGKLKTEELEEDTLVGASVLLSCVRVLRTAKRGFCARSKRASETSPERAGT